MIIPVRCFSCGKPIGHLWEPYKEKVAKGEKPKEVLDNFGLKRYCCRSLFLTHIDLIKEAAEFKR